MFITKKSLSRRAFLRGTGTALALPLLDAMVPALTAQSKSAAAAVTRFGFMYVPHGVILDKWTPAAAGADFTATVRWPNGSISNPFERNSCPISAKRISWLGVSVRMIGIKSCCASTRPAARCASTFSKRMRSCATC